MQNPGGALPAFALRTAARRWQAPNSFILNVRHYAMKARVTVTLKSGILDPQGKAIEGALKSLGVGGVASVRQGKVFDIEIESADRAGAEPLSRTPPKSSSPTP